MSDLERAIRVARPRTVASAGARRAAMAAALGALDAAPRTRRRSRRPWLVLAGAAAATAAVVAVALVIATGGRDQGSPIVVSGGTPAPASTTGTGATPSRPGVAASVVFRPAAGMDQEEAYRSMAAAVRARAARRGRPVEITRLDRDRMLVTLRGTREEMQLNDLLAGSTPAVYDLDDVLVGTFASLSGALRKARELAPDAPARMAWLVRPGGAVRGPAPRAADLTGAPGSLPADAHILELPEGYAVLRRQYVRNARGDAVQLRPNQYFLVRDEPAVTPLEITGVGASRTDTTLPGRPVTVPFELSQDGRAAWDSLLRTVSQRAASLGRPQRVVATTNGEVWQITTADATGALDTRPGSPAVEFGSFAGMGGLGQGLRAPVSQSTPLDGRWLPATVWINEVFPVGPPQVVLGTRISPLPARIRRAIQGFGLEKGDPVSARRALVATGPGGDWELWNYLTRAGSARVLVAGPRQEDLTGFACPAGGGRRIRSCGGSRGWQAYGVPPATTTLRFTGPNGTVDAPAGGGWAVVLGPRGSRWPQVRATAQALDSQGRVLARTTDTFLLP